MDQTIQPKRRWYKSKWFIIIVGVIALVIFSSFGESNTSNTSTNLSNIPSSGEEGYLRIENSEIVTLARTKEDYDELNKAMYAKDTYGIARMVMENKAFDVPVGTKVLVIDQKFGGRKVRILEGKYAMEDGWVVMEFVSKQ